MPIRQRPGDLGAQDARRLRLVIGSELRDGRRGLGLSQGTVATAAGISRAQVGRLERGDIAKPRLEQVCRCARVLGMQASLKLYPVGSPVRDRAHLALLGRFESRLGPPLRMRREVPLPAAADFRAWDGLVEGHDGRFAAEGETHLLDTQALTRRIELKVRDDPRVTAVVLVVARSRHNRDVLGAHRDVLRGLFPLDGAEILREIGSGRCPPAGGIVML